MWSLIFFLFLTFFTCSFIPNFTVAPSFEDTLMDTGSVTLEPERPGIKILSREMVCITQTFYWMLSSALLCFSPKRNRRKLVLGESISLHRQQEEMNIVVDVFCPQRFYFPLFLMANVRACNLLKQI